MSGGTPGPTATLYPNEEQYERWKADAEDMDMNYSEYMQAMIEAGRKKFDAITNPDETNRELREQRNDLKRELTRARERVATLEDRLHGDERATVQRYVGRHPGASFEEIVQHVIDTVPGRVNTHLDDLEGEDIVVEDGQYYPAEEGGA